MSSVVRTTISTERELWDEFLAAAQAEGCSTTSGAVKAAIKLFLLIHVAQTQGKRIQIDGQDVLFVF